VGNHIESLGEIQVGNVHCSPHISQGGYFVAEGNQVCQAQFALGESMLAFPKHVLHLTCDSPRDDSFHNFRGD